MHKKMIWEHNIAQKPSNRDLVDLNFCMFFNTFFSKMAPEWGPDTPNQETHNKRIMPVLLLFERICSILQYTLVWCSALAAGFTPFLEAATGASGSNARVLTSADTIDALILDAGSTGESAARFRIHVVLADISVNPTESATVSTGT